MEATFLTAIHINKVRHLRDIDIPLSSDTRKNLILTGKNGSGKTSVLAAISSNVSNASVFRNAAEIKQELVGWNTSDVVIQYKGFQSFHAKYSGKLLILSYLKDTRDLQVEESSGVQRLGVLPVYTMFDSPCRQLVKYLVNLKAIQAFARNEGNQNRAEEIGAWFQRFENIFQIIYDDKSVKLNFDIENFQFTITVDGREPFDFNTMSMGYAAVFDIIGDLIMRMESQHRYDLEGIVLIDEIETHLHVELQKKIVPILTELFPNIQFIMTTHSPFVLNSAQNAVIYDLENHMLVEEGLTNLPYEGIVEGYFGADRMSQELRNKFERYKALVGKAELTDEEFAETAELETYLDEVPDYLALEFSAEYSRLKLEFANRG